MKYATLSAVLQALADEKHVSRADVAARVLACKIYVAGAGQPGCLYDYGPHYLATKRSAIAGLYWLADVGAETDTTRGMLSALRRDGILYASDAHRAAGGHAYYQVSRTTLGSVL